MFKNQNRRKLMMICTIIICFSLTFIIAFSGKKKKQNIDAKLLEEEIVLMNLEQIPPQNSAQPRN